MKEQYFFRVLFCSVFWGQIFFEFCSVLCSRVKIFFVFCSVLCSGVKFFSSSVLFCVLTLFFSVLSVLVSYPHCPQGPRCPLTLFSPRRSKYPFTFKSPHCPQGPRCPLTFGMSVYVYMSAKFVYVYESATYIYANMSVFFVHVHKSTKSVTSAYVYMAVMS